MSAYPKSREIWFRWYPTWILIPGARIVHWKGYLVGAISLAVFAGLAYVTEKQFPLLALYWLGAAVLIVIYWMVVLDHSEWEKPKTAES